MTAPGLPPVESLHFDNVTATSRFVDWSEEVERGGFDPDEFGPVLPAVSVDVLDEFAPGWREDYGDESGAVLPDDAEAACEAFASGDLSERGLDDWRDSLWPAMNFAWPVRLGDVDAATAAARIRATGAAVTLVDMCEDWRGDSCYALALTGGGMDLSWDIAAAYIACGAVPPESLLSNLPRMAGSGRYGATVRDDVAAAVVESIGRAAGYMEARARRLREERAQKGAA